MTATTAPPRTPHTMCDCEPCRVVSERAAEILAWLLPTLATYRDDDVTAATTWQLLRNVTDPYRVADILAAAGRETHQVGSDLMLRRALSDAAAAAFHGIAVHAIATTAGVDR